MSEFGNNLSFNILSAIKNFGKQNKPQEAGDKIESLAKELKSPEQTNVTPKEALRNTNSNVPVNQSIASNQAVNQVALNSRNEPQNTLISNLKENTKNQVQSTPAQTEFQGARDLPAYAGVSNMSLKSWIAGQDNKNLAKLESGEKQLAATLDGIKGFQNQNYEGFGDDSGRRQNKSRNKNLLILSHIFSGLEQLRDHETELLVNITNFKKLGSSMKQSSGDMPSESTVIESKLLPPAPNELQLLANLDPMKIKYLHQLLALPSEFPEFLRLFASDKIELDSKQLHSFLTQRLGLAQSQLFGQDAFLNTVIANFTPLLSQTEASLLFPILLLYYPLPPPIIVPRFDFIHEWEKRKNKADRKTIVVASCEIYYVSKTRGRFLLRLELNGNNEFSFDIQTAKENNGVVQELEFAIAESMILLECPPLLSELNVLLTEEIYKATDIDEELSIVSSGPLRLEIILAAYAALIVLNKLNAEPDPAGLIEMTS